jgi:hypothetical protein
VARRVDKLTVNFTLCPYCHSKGIFGPRRTAQTPVLPTWHAWYGLSRRWPWVGPPGWGTHMLSSCCQFLGCLSPFVLVALVLSALSLGSCHEVCIPGRSDPGRYTVDTVKRVGPAEQSGVTLVTQLTLSKAGVLYKALQAWGGYSSIVLYAYDAKEAGAARAFRCEKCTVTLVRGGTRKQAYPINLLRQVALDAAHTELVFTLDTDFIPSAGIYDAIQQHLPKPLIGMALVVPAFEFLVDPAGQVPKFTDLRGLLDARKVSVFQSRNGSYHRDTNHDLWLRSENMYCLNSTRSKYEPYVIVNRTNARFPGYDVTYVDRGMNKMSWIRALRSAKFRFCVLPGVFMVHRWEPHPKYRRYSRKYTDQVTDSRPTNSTCAAGRSQGVV